MTMRKLIQQRRRSGKKQVITSIIVSFISFLFALFLVLCAFEEETILSRVVFCIPLSIIIIGFSALLAGAENWSSSDKWHITNYVEQLCSVDNNFSEEIFSKDLKQNMYDWLNTQEEEFKKEIEKYFVPNGLASLG